MLTGQLPGQQAQSIVRAGIGPDVDLALQREHVVVFVKSECWSLFLDFTDEGLGTDVVKLPIPSATGQHDPRAARQHVSKRLLDRGDVPLNLPQARVGDTAHKASA